MTDESARIPSVAATVRRYLLRGFLGDRFQWRDLVTGILFTGAIVLAVPRLDSSDDPLLVFMVIIATLNAWEAARREYLFGGPPRLVVTAGVTAFVGLIAYAALLYAASITFGPEPGAAPLDGLFSLPSEMLVGFLLALGALFVILYRTGTPGRERQDAEFRALVDAERMRRGKPPRHVDNEPSPKEAPGPVTIL